MDAFQITDIVRSKIVEHKLNEFTLSTVGRNFGVIHSDCSVCGTSLIKAKDGLNKLKCPFCGNIEYRKLADDYGNVKDNLRF